MPVPSKMIKGIKDETENKLDSKELVSTKAIWTGVIK